MRKTSLIIVIILYCANAYSQGCSDAGVCTSGKSGSLSNDSSSVLEIKLGTSLGMGEQDVTIFQGYAGVAFNLLGKVDLEAKLPYQYATGNLGSNSGVGDITTNIGIYIFKKVNHQLYFSSGIRIPSGSTNSGNDTYTSLPMPYQTGLGTTDLLTSVNYFYRTWKLSAGFQYVIDHHNKNEFNREDFSADSDAFAYFSSRSLERGNDILFRLDKYFKYRKWTLIPGAILIYRMEGDKVVTSDNVLRIADGSDGATLNLTGAVNRSLSKNVTLSFNFGFPLEVRDTRPDGLTRSLVTGLEISCFINKKSK